MSNDLTKQDQDLITDEETRYQDHYDQIKEHLKNKTDELADNEKWARQVTSDIVAASRDEDKAALLGEEHLAHGLAKMRLEQSGELVNLLKQPYFARVRYKEKGREVEFKLGLASFPEMRIIDWRKAPISTLYYDYEEGEEYDDEIAGRDRQGVVTLKRGYQGRENLLSTIETKENRYVKARGQWNKQDKKSRQTFSIQDKEKIKELLDNQDPTQWEQASSSGGYLHNVLSLLSPEQFQLISLDVDRPVIVQGSAGTGKTTVALHRLAWLLFEDNANINRKQSLVLMFSESLKSYVKYVLPELGVDDVPITTFYNWATDVIVTMTGQKCEFHKNEISETLAESKSNHQILDRLNLFLKNKQGTAFDLLFSFLQSERQSTLMQADQVYLDKQIQNRWVDSYDLGLLLHILYSQKQTYQSKKYPGSLDYLFVDEAQDFTIIELKAILSALRDTRKLTLAGDLGQKILENRDFGTWEELLSELGLDGVDVLSLNIAYRSTYQIYELAETIRDPNVSDDELHLTQKFGPEPSLTRCHGFMEAVRFTQEWVEEILLVRKDSLGAIICANTLEAQQVYSGLKKLGCHSIRFGDAKHFEFTPGITVTDIKSVKGLEFENVLIFNPSQKNYPNQKHARNQLYVAVTRAEFKLDFIGYEEPSQILPSFIREQDWTHEEHDIQDAPLFSDADQDLSRFEEIEEEKKWQKKRSDSFDE